MESGIHWGGILDPVRGINVLHHGIRDHWGGILNPVPGIRVLHHEIRNPLRWDFRSSTWDQRFTSWNSEPLRWNLEFTTWNPGSTSWKPESTEVVSGFHIMESGIHRGGILNPGIRVLHHGIRNGRLSPYMGRYSCRYWPKIRICNIFN